MTFPTSATRRQLLKVRVFLRADDCTVVFLIQLPVAPDGGLDSSWQEVLIRAHTQGWQFGRDVVFTYGPWGFLLGNCHLGHEGALVRLLWEFAGQLGLAVALVRLIRDVTLWRRVGFVAAVALFHRHDALYLAVIALVVLRRLLVPNRSAWIYFFWAAGLGCLSQLKLNYAAVVVAGIAAATGLATSQRRWPAVVAIVGGGAAGFFASWFAAGQAVANLWDYARASWEIILGNDGMALDESRGTFLIGLAIVLMTGAALWRLRQKCPGRAEGTALLGFLAAVWFIAWKHGYTRADSGHLPGFYIFTLYLAILLPGLYFPEKSVDWFDGVGTLCLVVLLTRSFQPDAVLREASARWITNVRSLAGIANLPTRWQAELVSQRALLGSAHLPELVGSKSIDAYNFNQAEVVLAPVNFTPRPIFQGYLANSSKLIEWNRQFYESDRAPEFILWRQLTIDGRYPTQDDAGLFLVVKQRYAVGGTVAGALLLQKRPAAAGQCRCEKPALRAYAGLGRNLCNSARRGTSDTLAARDTCAHVVWSAARIPVQTRPTLPVHSRRHPRKPALANRSSCRRKWISPATTT